MSFNPNAQLDPTQVEDRRGESSGMGGGFGGIGGGGAGFGVPIVVGGGGAGLVVMLILVALNLFGGALAGPSPDSVPADGSAAGYSGKQVAGSSVTQTCRTGADANSRTDCLVVGVVNSVHSYWSNELPSRGVTYSPADTVLYSGATQAGCGLAQSAQGPFYCPVDKKVYLDLSFFDELHAKFGAQGAALPMATSLRMSTGTTFRIWSDYWEIRAAIRSVKKVAPSGLSSRRTALRGCGPIMQCRWATCNSSPPLTFPKHSMPPPQSATIGSSRKRKSA